MFAPKTKKATFQGQEIEVKGLSVARALALRASATKDTADNMIIMAEVIAETVITPAMKVEDVTALDLETFRELFDLVADLNGLNVKNAVGPETI
jgi:hypothetical protein